MEPIHTLVIAATLAMRAGLRALLESDPDVEVVGETPDLGGMESPPDRVDVLVSAGSLPPASQIEEALSGLEGPQALLVMTDEPAPAGILTRLPLRSWGLLPLDASAEELTAAVRAVHQGLIVYPPARLEAVLSEPLPDRGDLEGRAEELTEREMEVLALLARGLANKQIAGELGISEHTVKFHVSSIYGKLGANNRAEAVHLGARQGLIPL